MFERFTNDARNAVMNASVHARAIGAEAIMPAHLVVGVLEEGSSAAARALRAAGITPAVLSAAANAEIPVEIPEDLAESEMTMFANESRQALDGAASAAEHLGHERITCNHVAAGALRSADETLLHVLDELGLDAISVVTLIFDAMAEEHSKNTPDISDLPGPGLFGSRRGRGETRSENLLEQFGLNLTAKAKEGGVDPVFGRDNEVERVLQTLARRSKNCPVLVGEPGVGKTAVAEALAARFAEGAVPDGMEDLQLISLDLGSMIAGARYRGDFEERFKKVLQEVVKDGNVVLFIDEIHSLVGAGAGEGSIDAANMLKPLLARGEIRLLGATTLDEYRKHIERDAALERRFQQVLVEEPSREDTIGVLRGLSATYAEFHGCSISDEALVAAVDMSIRYVPDRHLPDKAIDVIDEAGSRLRMQNRSSGSATAAVDAKIEEVQARKDQAVEEQDFEAAAAVRTEELELVEERSKIVEDLSGVRDSVMGVADVAHVIEMWTGVPVTQLTDDETERLLNMEDHLHDRIIGQHDAVSAVSRSVRRTRAGLKDPKRPGGSFIFLGPTGVGKTEMAKSLAEFMFGDDDALITFDMSEYMEAHTVSRLIGAPPGYAGYDEGGQLTEAVRRKPFSVVLFDEVEKAHPDVFNTLLQVLEDGRLTDSSGRSVDFSNTVLIMTSNLGVEARRQAAVGFVADDVSMSYAVMCEKAEDALKKHFRPEFLNRIDETIVFHELSRSEIVAMVDSLMGRVVEQLDGRGISLVLSGGARERLADVGYDPALGARPLRRVIQRHIEDAVAEKILFGDIREGQTVLVDYTDDFVFLAADAPVGEGSSVEPDEVVA